MKSLHIFSITAILVLFSSCESDLLKTTIGEGTAPLLNNSATDIVLLKEDSANVALTLNWTNPEYLGDTEQGDLVGKYIISIDKNESFPDPKMITLVNAFEKSFTVFEFNKILANLECEPDVVNTIYIRVQSVFFSSDTLVSNVSSMSVTPYNTVLPPLIAVPEELWISGNGLTTGWNSPFLPEQQFTKESKTSFSITIPLIGGGRYEMITNGAGSPWSPCYRLDPAIVPSSVVWGGTFSVCGEGTTLLWTAILFMAPPDNATYKITLDFQEATYVVVQK